MGIEKLKAQAAMYLTFQASSAGDLMLKIGVGKYEASSQRDKSFACLGLNHLKLIVCIGFIYVALEYSCISNIFPVVRKMPIIS